VPTPISEKSFQMDLGRFLDAWDASNTTMLCSQAPKGDMGPAFISPLQVAVGAAVVVVNAYISFSLQLGLHWQLIVGSIRCATS
jgi:hypothetical protein